jgi:CTP:molybdopterin cytidylyltransferase MocA
VAALRDRVRYVPVDDPFVALNINTPEDYAHLGSQSKIV